MEFTIDHFIEKLSAVPESKWCGGQYKTEDGRCDVLGLCGYRRGSNIVPPVTTKEGSALRQLAAIAEYNITHVNDGGDGRYQQATPKQRVMALLHDLKNKAGEAEE